MPVLTHSDPDGFVSAMIVVTAKKISSTTIHTVSYGENRDELFKKWLMSQLTPLPSHTIMKTANEDVYFTDLSLSVGELEWARNKKKLSRWIWIDHHNASANFNSIGIFDEVICDFSGEKCASDLVFEYLFKNNSNAVLKGWVSAAHDRDLWLNEDYQQGLNLDLMIRNWLKTKAFVNQLFTCNQMPVRTAISLNQKFIRPGLESLEVSKNLADKTTEIFTKDEQKFVFAYVHGNVSDVGFHLYTKHGLDSVIVMLHAIDDTMVINFRTGGNIDVSKLAKAFNGGGHPKAAGGKLLQSHLKGGYIEIYRDILRVIIEEERNNIQDTVAELPTAEKTKKKTVKLRSK